MTDTLVWLGFGVTVAGLAYMCWMAVLIIAGVVQILAQAVTSVWVWFALRSLR